MYLFLSPWFSVLFFHSLLIIISGSCSSLELSKSFFPSCYVFNKTLNCFCSNKGWNEMTPHHPSIYSLDPDRKSFLLGNMNSTWNNPDWGIKHLLAHMPYTSSVSAVETCLVIIFQSVRHHWAENGTMMCIWETSVMCWVRDVGK